MRKSVSPITPVWTRRRMARAEAWREGGREGFCESLKERSDGDGKGHFPPCLPPSFPPFFLPHHLSVVTLRAKYEAIRRAKVQGALARR